MLFWLVSLALAVPPPPGPPPPSAAPEQDPKELIGSLRSGTPAEQRYAARELRRQVRSAVRDERHAAPGSLQAMEATQTLVRLQGPLGLACMASLSDPKLTRSCAEMLGLLDVDAAVDPLQAALATEPGRLTRRTIERAIARIEEST